MKEYKIAFRSLMYGKKITAILSIVLCTVLFTTLVTTFSNVIASVQASEFRIRGTDCHLSANNIRAEEYSSLINDDLVESGGYSIIVGSLNDSIAEKTHTEVRYVDDYFAKHTFQFPTKGRLPVEKTEVAISSRLMELYQKDVGDTVFLSIITDQEIFEGQYTIVGGWESNREIERESVWVSLDWINENLEIGEENILLACLFMLNTKSNDIEYAFNQVSLAHPEIVISLNPAYHNIDISSFDSSIIALLVCGATIFMSAFLIIHNVFNIAIVKDMHEYGLLKALGCTQKQISKIVSYKVIFLCIVGIPIGLLIGSIIGILLFPYLSILFQSSVHNVYAIHPTSIILSVIFSALTVCISTRKPVNLAGRVAPVEAINYLDYTGEENGRREESKTVSPVHMARLNIKRSRKRYRITVASMALGLVVLNIIASIITSFSFEAFVSEQIFSDFAIKGTMNDLDYGAFSCNGISKEVIEEVQNLYAPSNCGNVYYTSISSNVSAEKVDSVTNYLNKYAGRDFDPSYKAYSTEYEIYGLNRSILEMAVPSTISSRELHNGEAYLVLPFDIADVSELPYKAGDSVVIRTDSAIKTFNIIGTLRLPDSVHVDVYTAGSIEIVISNTDFLHLFPTALPIMYTFDADSNIHHSIHEYLENIASSIATIEISSRIQLKETFRDLTTMVTVVGGSVVAILLLIGLLNFMNSICTSILDRRNELAILEAIGVTRKQCIQMLSIEGLSYGVYSFAVALAISAVSEVIIVSPISKMLPFLRHSFSILPLIVCIIPLILIACIVPSVYYNLNRRTIIENIRQSD